MYNSDYIPVDQQAIDDDIRQFEESRKIVLSKVRFDKGFENSVVGLDFMNELLIWPIWTRSKVNIRHVVFNVACEYLEDHFDRMDDAQYQEILGVINDWSKAFKCAYDHSSSVNFSWAFNELLKEVKPLIK